MYDENIVSDLVFVDIDADEYYGDIAEIVVWVEIIETWGCKFISRYNCCEWWWMMMYRRTVVLDACFIQYEHIDFLKSLRCVDENQFFLFVSNFYNPIRRKEEMSYQGQCHFRCLTNQNVSKMHVWINLDFFFVLVLFLIAVLVV